MRILSVVGTRPQFVKAAPVSRALRGRHAELLVHTGQHYDETMSAAFFRDLEIDEPDVNLEVGSGSHAAMTGEMLRRLEPVVLKHEPEVLLIYGDTNSTLAAAVVGAKVAFSGGRRPFLVHVEAGLRSFNPAMPEERNRIVADHLSELLLAPTSTAMANLDREGLAERSELVGDVMADAYAWAAERAETPRPEAQRPEAQRPAGATEEPDYLLLTLHRAENVDDPARLAAWLAALEDAGPVLFPVHPRTRARIAEHRIGVPKNVRMIDPVGYLAMVALERDARAIATDSGGVQKEAYLSGVPCLTLRGETEWVETIEAGWNRLVPPDRRQIRAALDDPSFTDRARPRPPLFGDGRSAERMVAAIERRLGGTGGTGATGAAGQAGSRRQVEVASG